MTLEKVVVVTRKTRLEGLIERFNSRAQAKFYLDHSGGDYADYEREDSAYRRAVDTVRRTIDVGLKIQVVERSLVPTMMFTEGDAIIPVGQDGLVANTAKYVGEQPIIAVNPDPERFDGILLRYSPSEARAALLSLLEGRSRERKVTLAEAELQDGQRLLGFNDLFIGARTHVSARYRIGFGGRTEPHSSSGVLVSTGAGSTGWLSSVYAMAGAVSAFSGGTAGRALRLEWEDPRLIFVVREPYVSRHSKAGIAAGLIEAGGELILESQMPSGGVIFSDGVEADALDFNSGARVHLHAAARKTHLIVN
jgi:NAD kinase